MKEEKLKKLLNELAEATAEPARPGLDEDIKHQIPDSLIPHRRGMNSINIIIDLRISKLTAAAAIVITMILLANLFGGRDATGDSIYQDGKLLLKYCSGWAGNGSKSMALGRSKYEYLVRQGKKVVYYGNYIDPKDSNAVLIHWKLSGGNYKAIFGDLREREVTAEELIELQTRMLQKKTK